ncbi:serine/threonine-protein kinase VRK1-like [Rhipicephalus sanguineus]|uniref:serine/threonine-protein kinase VRK1-like n=1 Tax=Rhipicephalus sanguineus TaxID=34632 RepID=UPI0018947EEE|nr:serine/threonine-protein kinase VRK1-like [Rhipicephalus sanguineus]
MLWGFLARPVSEVPGPLNMRNGSKHRIMVMNRSGEDLQNITDRRGNKLFLKSAFRLGMRVIDGYEYAHRYECIQADVNASSLVPGFGEDIQEKVYLVYHSVVCCYMKTGKHKEYKEDTRKVCDGTIEFRSGDPRIGAPLLMGDIEILGYNLLQWLCYRLPREDNLKNPKYVSEQIRTQLENIPLLKAIKEAGLKPDSRRLITPPTTTPRYYLFSPKKPVQQEMILAEDIISDSGGKNVVKQPPPAMVARCRSTPVRKSKRRSPAATKSCSGIACLVKRDL